MIAGAGRRELVTKFGDFTGKQAGAWVQAFDIHSCSVKLETFRSTTKKNIPRIQFTQKSNFKLSKLFIALNRLKMIFCIKNKKGLCRVCDW